MKEDYLASVMLADPLRCIDFCLEADGGIAVIMTIADPGARLPNKPAYIHDSVHGASRNWAAPWAG